MSSPNKQIFPVPHSDCNDGMTLLEHYAGMAMQGMYSSQDRQLEAPAEMVAAWSVQAAKALIAELAKEDEE